MRNIVGTPVQGEDFFGREEEIGYVWEMIEKGNNFIFPSPRRVGKTSFALKLIEIAASENWNTISINLEESAHNELDFLDTLIKKLQKLSFWNKTKAAGTKIIDIIAKLRPSVSVGGVEARIEWERHRDSVYKQVAELLPHDEPTLIFFDELTVLLNKILKNDENGQRNVKALLHWLRALRLQEGSKIRWIFCSSVGIENFAHQHGVSDTINDVPDFFLKSLDTVQSRAMLDRLGNDNGLPLDDTIKAAVVSKLQFCLPYFLQIIFDKIRYHHIVEKQTLTPKLVDVAYSSLIDGKHFNTWIERLEEQYNENAKHAFSLLRQLCQAKKGINRKSLVNTLSAAGLNGEAADTMTGNLLYMLQNDGYIFEEEKQYHFRSPLLRDFWYNRFVK